MLFLYINKCRKIKLINNLKSQKICIIILNIICRKSPRKYIDIRWSRLKIERNRDNKIRKMFMQNERKYLKTEKTGCFML